MLNFDNTVNYAPSFKKIDESIESINTLLTSLLLDTYTNQTFIYSDINVIRVNTSQNYDSIQSLSAGLPMKLDSSLSSNFFMKSNSGIFASSSTLSDKMNVSDFDSVSGNFFDKSNSNVFASTSTLSDKFNASDSTLFAMESDFERQISEKLNISDFNIYSLDFASTSTLSDKFNASDSTLFAFTSDLSSKFNASDSTYFLPSSDYSTQAAEKYLSSLNELIYTDRTVVQFSINGCVYNLEKTTISNKNVIFQNNQLLNGMQFSANTLFLESNTIVRTYVSYNSKYQNSFSDIRYNSLIGGYWLYDIYDNGYKNTFDGFVFKNSFTNHTYLKIKCDYVGYNHFSNCKSLSIHLPTINNGTNAMNKNSFYNITDMKIKDADLSNNEFDSIKYCTLDNVRLINNKFANIHDVPLYIKNEYASNNTFSYCDSIIFDIYNSDDIWTTQSNVFSHVNYVEFNIGPNVNINLTKFLGLDYSCSIGGININLSPGDDRKTMFETQLGYYGITENVSNLKSISFNSTNDWINSGFRNTLSSCCGNPVVLDGYYNGSRLNVQGSIMSSTGMITNLNSYYFQPKFSPNYNSLKHYMVLYGDSFRDYFELDPHALEAGHNNNACENILLQKDYTFFSTLATVAGKDKYTFIQWPSTELIFPKSAYSNNTLLNTINDITRYRYYRPFYLFYTFANNNYTFTETCEELPQTLFSQFTITSSSSQIYAGFSYSGLLTSTASTRSSIKR